MKVDAFIELLDSGFYTGVPDSRLKALCDYLISKYGACGNNHVIAANEGNAVAAAAGYHLATGKVPVVYMQNSGIGNAVNPVASLMNNNVYGIPCIFVIGWRGDPGIHDEPQHIFQGQITLKLMEDMDIETFVLDKDTSESELREQLSAWHHLLDNGRQVAIIVKKGALVNGEKTSYRNNNSMLREDIIKHIVRYAGDDPVISTTGKASRELFEIREASGEGHDKDFLTVGSMGHSSSIALGLALAQSERRFWCIDGDGAAIMHMGSLAVIGSSGVSNIAHIVVNNGAHESVGGMPTSADGIKMSEIARACGYTEVFYVADFDELDVALEAAKKNEKLTFIEVMSAIGAREDLGRPTTSAMDNKIAFMEYIIDKA